jgi:DNA end-binding protein Ku
MAPLCKIEMTLPRVLGSRESALNFPDVFEGMDGINVDPEMVELATQLVQRQAGEYDASDLEDRYETRLRAMIDAKLKGEGIDAAEEPEILTSSVVDLMETLRKSLGQVHEEKPAAKKPAAPKRSAAQAATKPSRKRA